MRAARGRAVLNRPSVTVPAAAVDLLVADVDDPLLRSLPRGSGSVEQWVDDVGVLVDPARRRRATGAGADRAPADVPEYAPEEGGS